MSSRPVIAVAIPRLSDNLSDVQVPSAEWLLARNSSFGRWQSDWRSWVLSQAGMEPNGSDAWPAGPCVRASMGGQWPDGTWLCATPTHLLTGIDHLQLASPDLLQLESQEAVALIESLNASLAERGLHVEFVEGDAWALRWSGFLQCSTFEPWEAVGRDVYDYMPAGLDGAKLRSLMNEIQMLLHDHPINARRVRGGKPAVNSLWLWGAGAARAPGKRKLPLLLTDDAWLKGIWRACGSEVQGWTGDWWQAMRSDERVILAPTCLSTGSWDASLFRPLRELLGRARAGELQLLIRDRTFTVTSSARWRFWCRPRGLAEWLA